MPLNLIFTQSGNYTIEDDGIPGNNTSVIKDGSGVVVFTFAHPADSLSFTAGVPGVNITVNITDSLGAANFTIGDLTNAAVTPESIAIRNVQTTGIVTLVANGAITEAGSDAAPDIVAGQVILSAGTGIGAGNAIETQTSAFEAETNTGGIAIGNFGAVQIGGISDDVDGLEVTTSGDINFTNYGTILLGDDTGTESVRGGASGNVILNALGFDSDIIANADNDAITVPGGSLFLSAGRDIGFGIIGSNFDNDVRAAGAIIINAGRDFLIDGFSDLASDDFLAGTGGNVNITAGRNIQVRSVAGTDGSIFANGNAGADVILTTGVNGAVVVDPASIFGAPQPVASNSGDVLINADRLLINSSSGIGAPLGQVVIVPRTAGRSILLGSAGDAAFAIELSNAELARIFTPNLRIGDGNSGQLSVINAVSFTNAPNVTLRTGTDISINAALSLTGALSLNAGDNLLGLSGTINAGSVSAIVDEGGNEGALGQFPIGVTASGGILLNGGGGGDTLRGAESVEQTVHGNGGNDSIFSSGEGHYFGDGGDDRMLAGLSSGLVPEVLDGGIGVDTLDTTSFGGSYVINLATGVTNFDYESFVNFENVITGGGNDTITGSAANNGITSGGGNDVLDGAGGADTMVGGLGDDTYMVDNGADSVIEVFGGGSDTVYASNSYALTANQEIEVLSVVSQASTAALNLTGNAVAQTLIGNAGDNLLDGGGGADVLYGLGGNDSYVVDNLNDQVIEATAAGNDVVYASASYTLVAGQSIEVLSAFNQAGTGALDLTGNALAQTLIGNAGSNVLNGGGGGADALYGLGGNDNYVVDGDDLVIEGAGGGSDAVYAIASHVLAAGQEVEVLSAFGQTGTGALNLTGNAFAQTLIGNAGDNVLNGGGGADALYGLGGNDTFAFNTALGAGNIDTIIGFVAGGDKIALDDAIFITIGGLGALNPNAFVAGTAAADASDRIIYNSATGQLLYDADGVGGVAAVQFAILDNHAALAASDFMVI
jgi:serralysin